MDSKRNGISDREFVDSHAAGTGGMQGRLSFSGHPLKNLGVALDIWTGRHLAAIEFAERRLAENLPRAGDRLEFDEQRALLRELDTIPWAPTCPHGRPVAIQLDRSEIERRFGRR